MVAHDRVGLERETPGRRDEPVAPVPEGVTIPFEGHGWYRQHIVRSLEIGETRRVDIEHRDDRRVLHEVVGHFTADMDAHQVSPGDGRVALPLNAGSGRVFRFTWLHSHDP